MSVRRLADEAIQPREFAFTPENLDWAKAKAAEYPDGHQQSAVIPILMRAQEQEGWISRPALEYVGQLLDMPYIRVLEIATFYTQFQLHPVGRNGHIQVCGTTPCMLRGAEDLIAVCRHRIHPEPGHPNADGTLSWEEVECMGACVNAPMVMIGQDTYEDLTAERFEEIVAAFAEGRGDTIPPGTQIDRQFSAPIGGETTLTRLNGREAEAAGSRPDGGSSGEPSPEPTKKGRMREISEEGAPALSEPQGGRKLAEETTEAARADASSQAKANGRPNRAMRDRATGAESPAGKQDAGEAPGKVPGAVAAEGLTPLFERPDGPPDNLKVITGIGPKLEAELHAIGITTYGQLAALTPEEIARVEAAIGIRGRIGRDNWTGQAEALARGGVAEYERVFGRKPGTR